METKYITLTKENIATEHICCAFSDSLFFYFQSVRNHSAHSGAVYDSTLFIPAYLAHPI